MGRSFLITFMVLLLFYTQSPMGKSLMIPTREKYQLGQNLNYVPDGEANTTVLNLGYNCITSLQAFAFYNASYRNISHLKLAYNNINDVSALAFHGLQYLDKVDIAHNALITLDSLTFNTNIKLRHLDLSANQIEFRPLQVFLMSESLETLVLSYNSIKELYSLTFVGVPNLKNLLLDFNQIQLISAKTFKPLEKLQLLSLSNTAVHRLSASMFGNLPKTIDIKNTPLANRFERPLGKVSDNAVTTLIQFDKYIFGNIESNV